MLDYGGVALIIQACLVFQVLDYGGVALIIQACLVFQVLDYGGVAFIMALVQYVSIMVHTDDNIV